MAPQKESHVTIQPELEDFIISLHKSFNIVGFDTENRIIFDAFGFWSGILLRVKLRALFNFLLNEFTF